MTPTSAESGRPSDASAKRWQWIALGEQAKCHALDTIDQLVPSRRNSRNSDGVAKTYFPGTQRIVLDFLMRGSFAFTRKGGSARGEERQVHVQVR